MSSGSASVHRPVAAGSSKSGTSYYSSAHLSDDKFMSITDIETRSFHDAGDMRSEAEGRRSDVNSYLTETSAAPETKNSRSSHGSEVHVSSSSARLDGSSDQRHVVQERMREWGRRSLLIGCHLVVSKDFQEHRGRP